jgi:hypothetical protein
MVMTVQSEVCAHIRNPTKNIGMETYVIFRNVYATLDEDLTLQGAAIVWMA